MPHRLLTAAGLIVLATALLAGGIFVGVQTAKADHPGASGTDHDSREFMFQVRDLKTPNQGGQTINLFFHYRYNEGIVETDIPNYLSLRKTALAYLTAVDVSKNPYWETLNNHLCRQLKRTFPVQAISCELQVVGENNTPGHYEPGYHASIETLGDIAPLVIPGPP